MWHFITTFLASFLPPSPPDVVATASGASLKDDLATLAP